MAFTIAKLLTLHMCQNSNCFKRECTVYWNQCTYFHQSKKFQQKKRKWISDARQRQAWKYCYFNKHSENTKEKRKKMQQKEFLMQQGFPTSEHLVAMYVETCFEFYWRSQRGTNW